MSNPTNSLEVVPREIPEYVEQNVSMVQQYATARIQSAYQVALARPRQIEVVRQEVLRECQRPSFCTPDETKNGSSLAIYRVPRGSVKQSDGTWTNNNIEGPTIRFAEMLLRSWRYLSIEVNPMGEDDKQRMLQVICTDYQSCNFTSEIVAVPKTVERKKPKAGDEVVSQRTNTYGDPVYLVKATDDELAMRTNALISKARRNLILQAVPGWLIEEGVDMVRTTARTKDAQDPDAARRKLFDAYRSVGVSVEQIVDYLGHTNALSPAELEDLRGYYSGIKDGFTTWSAVVASKEGQAGIDDKEAEANKLMAELEYTNAVARRTKAKYLGNYEGLVVYLQSQIAKKKNDGGKVTPITVKDGQTVTEAAREAIPQGESRQEFENDRTQGTGGSNSAKAAEQETPKPQPVVAKQPTAPKPTAAPVEEEGW
jgi:hypothetical protein